SGSELEDKYNLYSEAIFNSLKSDQINDVVLRHSRRRIDRSLKKVDLSRASSVGELSTILDSNLSELNIAAISDFKQREIE
ncbi:ABC transporter ATP-binding protein, partial [Vibrio parahaemolyticus]